jgi:hypothetical protein
MVKLFTSRVELILKAFSELVFEFGAKNKLPAVTPPFYAPALTY